jgi:sugar lactone lactonase YvrE
MLNTKGGDKSFSTLYALKKRNLLTQVGRGKKPAYSSEELILTNQRGFDSILRNPTIILSLEIWIKFDASTFQTYIFPGPIAPDGQGNFYIGNTYSPTSQITKVDSNGKYLANYTPPTGSVSNSTDGWPWGLAFYNGILYVAEMRKQFIHSLNITTSTWQVKIGASGVSGFTSGLSGLNSRLRGIADILSDGLGNLYICQQDNNAISKYVISTDILTTVAGSGMAGYADGIGIAAQFGNPANIFLDNSGNIIVCDTGNRRIRKIVVSTGVVTTVAGTGVSSSLDGPVGSATFTIPQVGCCDANGNFYIVDNDKKIRKISNGIVSTILESDKELTDNSFISNLTHYQGYVYVSDQFTQNTYRFKV